jgi:uncharacterized protein (DUF4213/DUF364 family)
MRLLDDLLEELPDREVIDVRIGLRWTAVVVESDGHRRCGLASTLSAPHQHTGQPDVPNAGHLQELSAMELARFSSLEQPTLASVGIATINALQSPDPELLRDHSAEDVIAAYGANKTVALVGGFPFIPRLRTRVGKLLVLENHPRDGELPADAAPTVLPQTDLIAITGMALVNHTLERLLEYCPPQATILVLGPSTPLSPILFKHRIDILCGSLVTAIDPVVRAVGQGADFHQIRRAGVRLVTMSRLNLKTLAEDS